MSLNCSKCFPNECFWGDYTCDYVGEQLLTTEQIKTIFMKNARHYPCPIPPDDSVLRDTKMKK